MISWVLSAMLGVNISVVHAAWQSTTTWLGKCPGKFGLQSHHLMNELLETNYSFFCVGRCESSGLLPAPEQPLISFQSKDATRHNPSPGMSKSSLCGNPTLAQIGQLSPAFLMRCLSHWARSHWILNIHVYVTGIVLVAHEPIRVEQTPSSLISTGAPRCS